MSNEFNYENGNHTENTSNTGMTGNAGGTTNGEYHYRYSGYGEPYNYNHTNHSGNGSTQKKPHDKKKIKKVAVVAGMAILFGVVGGITFQGTSFLTGKILGTSKSAQSETIGTAELTKSNNTGTDSSTGVANVAEVAENVMPSVVSITNMTVSEVRDFFGGVREQQAQSSGSGIIIGQNDTELLIVTNNHVIENSTTLTVSFVDNSSVEAKIKGTDASRDLAVVAVTMEDISSETKDAIKVATLGDSSALKVGEQAIAIGNALGYGQSVTTGIISATDRELEGMGTKVIQTDAAINPGNSGGALLNSNGEVIGINSAKINDSSVEGMGYAIPISDVTDVITDLMNQKTKEKVPEAEQGYIGIAGVDVTSESAQMYNMPTGVYVSEITKGGGAEKAGITKGSIITAIEGSTVTGMEELKEQLTYYRAGEAVTLTIQTPNTNGEYKETQVEVTLTAKTN